MPAHVLPYSEVVNNLTPKHTQSDTVVIISGHFPAYMQRSILSARGIAISLCYEIAK
jgi:hypothetical protein